MDCQAVHSFAVEQKVSRPLQEPAAPRRLLAQRLSRNHGLNEASPTARPVGGASRPISGAVRTLNAQLEAVSSPEAIAARLLDSLATQAQADSGSLMVVETAGDHFRIAAALGHPIEARGQRVPIAASVSGVVIEMGEPLLLSGRIGSRGAPRRGSVSSALVLPVFSEDEPIAVVNLNRNASRVPFNEKDLAVAVETIARLRCQFKTLKVAAPQTADPASVNALLLSIDAKDQYTRAHCQRVELLARGLSEFLSLDEVLVEQIAVGASLHDVGKIGVPESILCKAGPLDDEEYLVVRLHPKVGHSIIRPLGLPQATVDAVEHHHERYDGSGYPDGLAGDAIALSARLLGVVDAFDAMTVSRPYRGALPPSKALDELQRCAGTQFEPEIVAAFIEYCRQEGLDRTVTSIEVARQSPPAAGMGHERITAG